MSFFETLGIEAQITARSLMDFVSGTGLRLGVTGLSRAGKTVFITGLVQSLVRQSRLPVFCVVAEQRLIVARLEPQPDDGVPRFAYEEHLAAMEGEGRHWPQSTRRISQLRLTLEYESRRSWRSGRSHFTIDIVDYPGEWLLDLPLLGKSYATWSRETLAAAEAPARASLAGNWLKLTHAQSPECEADEELARKLASSFTDYLRAARADQFALSTLPPGRFLLPGDMEGSPALTFAPLEMGEGEPAPNSLGAMMTRRYEAYKSLVVRPFFRDHFARLDRQIVLVDALSALNSGPAAVRDLETAMVDILGAFRAGRGGLLATLLRPKIDRILFAATKADHLHHLSHDRLEAILRMLTARAIARVEGLGANVDVIALAAVRATREAGVKQAGAILDAIIGTPIAGEKIDGEVFNGLSEAAIFPGELPADPSKVFRGDGLALAENDLRFVRFRPPPTLFAPDGTRLALPHIRMDRAFEFLFGDKLQ